MKKAAGEGSPNKNTEPTEAYLLKALIYDAEFVVAVRGCGDKCEDYPNICSVCTLEASVAAYKAKEKL